MNKNNSVVDLAGALITALCGNLTLDVVQSLTGLNEVASMVEKAVDLNVITQRISILMSW